MTDLVDLQFPNTTPVRKSDKLPEKIHGQALDRSPTKKQDAANPTAGGLHGEMASMSLDFGTHPRHNARKAELPTKPGQNHGLGFDLPGVRKMEKPFLIPKADEQQGPNAPLSFEDDLKTKCAQLSAALTEALKNDPRLKRAAESLAAQDKAKATKPPQANTPQPVVKTMTKKTETPKPDLSRFPDLSKIFTKKPTPAPVVQKQSAPSVQAQPAVTTPTPKQAPADSDLVRQLAVAKAENAALTARLQAFEVAKVSQEREQAGLLQRFRDRAIGVTSRR